jgi:hypothetical protein
MNVLEILNEIEQAYREDIFPMLTVAEIVDMTTNRRGIIDRASASMGRHLAKLIREKLSKADEEFLEWWDLNRLAFFHDDNIGVREIAAKAWEAGQVAISQSGNRGGEARLRQAAQALIDYRRRAGLLNFQLEKADDFLREIGLALAGEVSEPPIHSE